MTANIACEGYRQSYVRTGYEYLVSNRTTDIFAYSAERNGVVKTVNEFGIIVEYDDGELRGVELGTIFGKSEGSIYPHKILTPLKEGDKIVKGDIVAFNSGFFEFDFLDPKKVVMKNSFIVKTALMETPQTLEDSSSISAKTSQMLSTKTTKVKSVVLDFKEGVLNMVKKGSVVNPGDILLTVEDEITSGNKGFDDAALLFLQNLSNQNVVSKYKGVIDGIEVLYNGSINDMSPSLKKLTVESDKNLANRLLSSNKPVLTGRVSSEYRVDGTPLTENKVQIKLYITVTNNGGVGDKGSFANQLKTVFGEVMDYDIISESGEKIDAIFGDKSIAARIVTSPYLMGTTITLLRVGAKKAVQIYRN